MRLSRVLGNVSESERARTDARDRERGGERAHASRMGKGFNNTSRQSKYGRPLLLICAQPAAVDRSLAPPSEFAEVSPRALESRFGQTIVDLFRLIGIRISRAAKSRRENDAQ